MKTTISDKEYIEDLEGLVKLLAGVYIDNKKVFCPNRLDKNITEIEKLNSRKFIRVQGFDANCTIPKFADSKKPIPKNLNRTVERYFKLN